MRIMAEITQIKLLCKALEESMAMGSKIKAGRSDSSIDKCWFQSWSYYVLFTLVSDFMFFGRLAHKLRRCSHCNSICWTKIFGVNTPFGRSSEIATVELLLVNPLTVTSVLWPEFDEMPHLCPLCFSCWESSWPAFEKEIISLPVIHCIYWLIRSDSLIILSILVFVYLQVYDHMRPDIIFHNVLTLHLGTAAHGSTVCNQGLLTMITGRSEYEGSVKFYLMFDIGLALVWLLCVIHS